jgi:hypothetical protein
MRLRCVKFRRQSAVGKQGQRKRSPQTVELGGLLRVACIGRADDVEAQGMQIRFIPCSAEVKSRQVWSPAATTAKGLMSPREDFQKACRYNRQGLMS